MSVEFRFSLPGDEPGLKSLWRSVFSDTGGRIDAFFQTVYTPGAAAVCLSDGVIVSAAYSVKLGDLVSDGRWTPCRAVCGWGTLPEARGQGYGGKVLKMAVDAATTSGIGVVRPISPSLFPLYEGFGFKPFSTVSRHDCVDVGLPLNGSVTSVTLRGYAALREELLHGQDHIDPDMKALEYWELTAAGSGGGLYYLVSDGVRCCAAVETEGERAYIRELIVPSGSQYNAAALVARAVNRERFVYDAPVRDGDEAAPLGMIWSSSPVPEDRNAWLGIGFSRFNE